LTIRLLQLPLFRHRIALVALAPLACMVLGACQPSANLSAGANVPAQYAHVWVTMQQVAFNTSATAGPSDSGWQSFTLSTPQTIDLAALTNGTLAQFASSLSLTGGTYAQMRLVLADSNVALTSSASSAGAVYNDEVDYVTSSGELVRVPLQVPNAAQGVTLPVSLTIENAEQATLAAIACAATSSSSGTTLGTSSSSTCEYGTQTASDCTSGSFYDSLIGTCVQIGGTNGLTGTDTLNSSTTTTPSNTCAFGTTYDASTGSCVATTTGSGVSAQCSYDQVYNPVTGTCASSALGLGGSSAATSYVAVDFDASRDLVPYTVSGQSGFVLIPHLSGYNLSDVGTIAGQVDVSGLPSTGVGGIQVTAETSNGTQNLIVASAPLQSNGAFVLYPLPCTSTATTTTAATSYSSSSSSGSAAYSCSTASQDFDLVIHGPGIQTVIIQSVPVTAGTPSSTGSINFGVTLTAASSYTVNLSSAATPPGAWIGFYQTLPNSSSAPYLIEAYPIDPFTGTFDTAQPLSNASLEYGVYASGGTVSLTAATPVEGASTYSVGASAPVYGNGSLNTTVAPPAAGAASATFTVAAIALPSTGESISGTVSVTTPGKYDKGELLLTQGGALVAVKSLDAYLGAASTSATLFMGVPGGTSTSVYYAEAWVWNSADPGTTLSRQPISTAINVSTGNATGVAVTIN
jgi:hypothetical protein